MLNGAFGRTTSYLALAIGVFGIVSILGFGVTLIVNALLATSLDLLRRIPAVQARSAMTAQAGASEWTGRSGFGS